MEALGVFVCNLYAWLPSYHPVPVVFAKGKDVEVWDRSFCLELESFPLSCFICFECLNESCFFVMHCWFYTDATNSIFRWIVRLLCDALNCGRLGAFSVGGELVAFESGVLKPGVEMERPWQRNLGWGEIHSLYFWSFITCTQTGHQFSLACNSCH